MRKQFLQLLSMAAIAAPLPLLADDSDTFATLDKNKDGFVTKDEVPEDKLRQFERLLRNNDKNSDGKLSREEFTAKTEEPRTPPPGGGGAAPNFDPAEYFKRLDRDGDGKISKEEAPDRFKENFDRIDANGDGKIELAEFREMAARLGGGAPGRDGTAREAEAIFERGDANKDGKLTLDEVPEERREMFQRVLDKVGGGEKSVSKEQFVKALVALRGGQADPPRKPEPGASPNDPSRTPPPGGGPVPLIRMLDTDGDGELSAEEIANAPKLLLKLDRNGDGKLSRDELPAFGGPGSGGGDSRAMAEQMLRRLKDADKNGDGKISKDEAPPGIAAMFDRLDGNSDGVLDPAELKSALEKLGQRVPEAGGDAPRERPKPRE